MNKALLEILFSNIGKGTAKSAATVTALVMFWQFSDNLSAEMAKTNQSLSKVESSVNKLNVSVAVMFEKAANERQRNDGQDKAIDHNRVEIENTKSKVHILEKSINQK